MAGLPYDLTSCSRSFCRTDRCCRHLTPTGQRRERSERPLEPSVSQHSSERWATFCFCLLSFTTFRLFHGALISTPPSAKRQTLARIPLDLYSRLSPPQKPPETTEDLAS